VLENLHYAAMSRKGPARQGNEDNFAIISKENVYPVVLVVADGMGGHLNGELASKTAVEGVRDDLFSQLPDKEDKDKIEKILEDTTQEINITIYKRSLEKDANTGMGTTMTCAVIYPTLLYLCQIGDSRCYRMRSDKLEQMTRDQTLVQEMIDLGEIDDQEARQHPQRHILTQALGSPDYISPGISTHEIKKDDRYLLCSDGLHGFLPDEDISRIMQDSDSAKEAAGRLVDKALASGGQDDVTVIVAFAGNGGSNERE
jgi:serine/threonine protein phosphatase PrpC